MLVTLFAAGLVTSGVVASAGPLAVLSDSTTTEAPTNADTTSTESTTEPDTTSDGTTTGSTATESATTTEPEPTTEGTPAPSGPPTIASDKPEYMPGELVTLTGSNWQPGETVNIDVNDNQGQTWRRNVDVVADTNGNVVDQFNLPDWFVATYAVVATGSQSGTAATTFADGNVQARTNTGGPTVTLTYTRFSGLGCTGSTIAGPTMVTISPASGSTILFAQDNGSYRLAVPGTAGTQVFNEWTSQASFSSTANPLCFNAVNGNRTFTANYVVPADSTPPTVLSIDRVGSSPTNTTGNLAWTVTFSESVIGVNAADFALAASGLGGSPAVVSVSGGPTSYTVTASSGTGSGTLGLNLVDDDSIADAAGNKLGGTGAGNGNFTGQIYTIDRTAPTVTAAAVTVPDSAPYSAGTWTNKDVRVTFTCADTGGAGLTAGSGNQVVDFTAETGGATATFSGTCADNAGNVAGSSSFGLIKIDKTKPTITAAATSPPGGAAYTGDWTNQDVQVSFTCADTGGSGIATNTVAGQTLSAEGVTPSVSSTGTCTDVAGNVADTASFGPVKIDTTKPTLTASATSPPDGAAYTAGDWTRFDVKVAFDCQDGLSGIGSSGDTVPDVIVTAEGQTASVSNTGTCTDRAGNVADGASFGPVKIDKTAPTLTASATSPPGGAAYSPGTWTRFDVKVEFDCQDALSGVDTDTVLDETVSTEGADQSATSSGDCADKAGNAAAAATFANIDIDKTNPTLTASATSPPDGAAYVADTWTRFNVKVAFDCQDALAGVATDTVADVTVSVEGETPSVGSTGDCVDAAGNEADGASFGPVKIDKTKPTLTSAATSPPGGAPYPPGTWTRFSVEVTFDCQDALSGVAADTVPDETVSGEGENQSATSTGNCTDAAGNEADPETFSNIDIDKTKPTLTASATSPPDGAGYVADTWTRFNVKVAFACADALSGVDVDTVADETVSAEGETTSVSSTGDCVDEAGNEANGASFGPVKIDKTAPTLTASATSPPGGAGYAAGTWTRFSVEVAFACADALSGVATDTVADMTVSDEGANQSVTSSGNCTDAAGNEAAPATFSNIDIDKTKPTLTPSATSPPGGATYTAGTWTRFSVEVAFACADALSGVGTDTVPNVTLTVEGSNQSVTSSGTCMDNAGNEADPATFANIDIDKSNPNTPSASADRAPDYAGGGGWYKDTVTVSFAHNGDPDLADATPGSGVDVTSVPGPQTFTASGPHTRTGTVKDNAGNESASASLTVQVDAIDPTFGACTGGPFLLGSGMQPVSITASDAHSGLNAGASTLSGSVDTSTIGAKNVVFTAVDNVGHSVTNTCTYAVIFNFHGFFQPVDNNGVFNVVNSGRAIPLKFDLSGNQGLDIFAPGYPKSTVVPCNGSAGTDVLEETVTAGSSSLHYSEGQPFGQYNYVWKTDKAWANTCRRMDMKFIDGTTHSALFKFTR